MDELETIETTESEEPEEPEEPEEDAAETEKRSRTAKPELTADEQMRLAEAMLYCYFNQRDESNFGSAAFWTAIRSICEMYGVDSLCVSKGIRILLVESNKPTDLEIWYLLDKTLLSVRQIRNISGIYWQKQKKLKEEVEAVGAPKCKPRIADPALRKGIKDFLFAMYGILGIFQFTDAKTLEKALC